MKKYLHAVLLSILCFSAQSQSINPNHQWFEEARFGLFVHFGPYSVLSDGEWVLNSRELKAHSYLNLQRIFNPQAFDAKGWVQLAKNAGMKYITFTSRHHDGFSNWDTKLSDWNIMNTPYGKDLIKQLADECHKEDIKLVLYYSLLDWIRDDYSYWTGRTGQHTGRTTKGEWDAYIQFMKAQLTELLTNYGEIAGIWFDGEWDQMAEEALSHDESAVDWHFPELYELIHTLQPNCMIANNHHLAPLPGEDYQIFERDLPGGNETGFAPNQTISNRLPLETCGTINGSWGYRMKDENYKSHKDLITYLVNAAGNGANLLLNVGPMPNGEIQKEFVERLHDMGEWMKQYGHTIYGTKAGIVRPQTWGAITQNDQTLYIHILNKEKDHLNLPIKGRIKSAQLLNDHSKIKFSKDKKTGEIIFDLTQIQGPAPDYIIEVIMK